jgi:tetratricopeptide (TPR) repeat protein
MTSQQKKVMISSSARDLPEHREEVMDACLRQDMFPLMMEHLPASDDEAVATSLGMVDEADLYIGVFAYRYGYVPKTNNPRQISITEMEYERAVQRNMPRLIFVIDEAHPITFQDVERGEGAIKLDALRKQLLEERVVNFFESPADLRAHVINSLSHYRDADFTTFHYVSDIPVPPEAYVAHPYTLLQTGRLIGRQEELNLLTDWITESQPEMRGVRILSIVAIGGLGKSALTWKWFNEIAPHEQPRLAGRMWWSFYESDASFENFVVRALAYVTRRSREEVAQIPPPEREAQLLAALDREPFLIVLDGLERILIAYARMDAAYLSDDDLDQQRANVVANAHGLPADAAQSITGQHRLRKTADPRMGAFLRKLANVRATRILLSTRLYPAELQGVTGEPLPGCRAVFLSGLKSEDALEMWRTLGVSGARDELLPLFERFDSHPLLLQALAGEVARFRPSPGDWERWRQAHPDFDPFGLPLVQARSHVLAFALMGLDERSQKVLNTVAAFRMPARYDTLAALLVGPDKTCPDERTLDALLTDLEDRGLLGWDRRANRYDLHPIVRGVVWSGLGEAVQRNVYEDLRTYFEAIPTINRDEITNLEELTPAIELYHTLLGLERYEDAFNVIGERMLSPLFELSANRQIAELIERMLSADQQGKPVFTGFERPREGITSAKRRHFVVSVLAMAYQFSGKLRDAIGLYRSALQFLEREGGALSVFIALYTNVLCASGMLAESEQEARRALIGARIESGQSEEAITLAYLGQTLAVKGYVVEARAALERASAVATTAETSIVNSFLSQFHVWLQAPDVAHTLADQAAHWSQVSSSFGLVEIVRAIRLQGTAALELGDLESADEQLHHALSLAREVNLVEEELATLISLAELQRRRDDLRGARELLEDAWDLAERGPFVLLHADAYNVLAHIERDTGNNEAAVDAATSAYRLAWCDGPPFAYHWGLAAARRHLNELAAPEPEMPPFDPDKHGPMPEVQIEPEDTHQDGTADIT